MTNTIYDNKILILTLQMKYITLNKRKYTNFEVKTSNESPKPFTSFYFVKKSSCNNEKYVSVYIVHNKELSNSDELTKIFTVILRFIIYRLY